MINVYAAAPSYTIQVLYKGGVSTVITGTLIPTGVNNPAYTAITPITSVSISKLIGLAGACHHFVFAITLASTGLTQYSSIFITFPVKYS